MSKNTLFLAGVILISLLALWSVFKPTYENTIYQINDKESSTFTIIEYRSIKKKRVLIFVKGKYDKNSLPQNNYVLYPDFSGFDEMFDFIATEEGGIITINYYSGYFDPNCSSLNIRTKRVDTEEWIKLRKSANSLFVRKF